MVIANNKKDSFDYWEKIIHYLCIDTIMTDTKYDNYINGFSVSPKINNCIFKIWNSDYHFIKTEYLRKDLDFISSEEVFYLQHSAD